MPYSLASIWIKRCYLINWPSVEEGEKILHPDLLISGFTKSINLYTYETFDIVELAAAYTYGLIKNHGFVDGNKRTGWVAARLFLLENGFDLHYNPIEAFQVIDGVAARLSRKRFWLPGFANILFKHK